MNIAICEDNLQDMKQLEAYIDSYFHRISEYVQIRKFMSTEQFLESGLYCDLLFINIHMQNMGGLQTVRTLNGKYARAVVFVSSSGDYAVEAFAIGAVHYLLKPLQETQVYAAIGRCIRRKDDEHEHVLMVKSTVSGIIYIPTMQIRYIEVFDKISVIYMYECETRVYQSLNALYDKLDKKQFIKIQRSFVVNMEYIGELISGFVVLKNGKKISISRGKRGEIMEQYWKYLFRRGQLCVRGGVEWIWKILMGKSEEWKKTNCNCRKFFLLLE